MDTICFPHTAFGSVAFLHGKVLVYTPCEARARLTGTGGAFGKQGGSISFLKGWCLSNRACRQVSCRHRARFKALQLAGSGFVRMHLAGESQVWPALQSSTAPERGHRPSSSCPQAHSHLSQQQQHRKLPRWQVPVVSSPSAPTVLEKPGDGCSRKGCSPDRQGLYAPPAG